MAVELLSFDNDNGVVFHCHGVLNGQELISALKRMPSAAGFKTIKYVLVDETDVESVDISTSEVHEIFKQQKHLTTLTPLRTIAAIAAPTLLGFGLARMWEALALDLKWVSKVFRARPQAEVWIKAKMQEIYQIDVNFQNPEGK